MDSFIARSCDGVGQSLMLQYSVGNKIARTFLSVCACRRPHVLPVPFEHSHYVFDTKAAVHMHTIALYHIKAFGPIKHQASLKC